MDAMLLTAIAKDGDRKSAYEEAVHAIMELTDEERRILLSRWKAANHI